MTILAFEFSSSQRSVAVARGNSILSEAVETGGRNTAAFGMIETVLREAKMEREEIEAIAVGLGPGSYTGIRAAIAIAQGWSLARPETKFAGVSSVEAIAEQSLAENFLGSVAVAVDAQRNEFYLAAFEIFKSGRREISPLKILPRREIQSLADAGGVLLGPDIQNHFSSGKNFFPRAGTVAALAARSGNFISAEALTPIYLREVNFVKAPASRQY